MHTTESSKTCPITRLKRYQTTVDIFLAWMQLVIWRSLKLSETDTLIHTRRSFQRTFLSWWIEFLPTYCPQEDGSQKEAPNVLGEFWKDVLTRWERPDKLKVISEEIAFLQDSQRVYHQIAKSWQLGNVKKIASNVLELTHTIPEMNDEMHFIVNVYLIVDICIGLHHNKEKNIDRSNSTKRITLQILQSLLILQKEAFNNRVAAFMFSVGQDDVTWKDYFPIELTWENDELDWKFSKKFRENLWIIENEWEYSHFGYTDMTTSCPAATDGIMSKLVDRVHILLKAS